MAGSAAEREIRDAVVAHLRANLPGARIIHELVCGSNRADLAAVERERITLFEIKSERDVLARTKQQMQTFRGCAHAAVLVAHERWFDRTPYNNGAPRFVWPDERDYGTDIWCYPHGAGAGTVTEGQYRWRMPRVTLAQPAARLLLDLLWNQELLEECARARMRVPKRANHSDMVDLMAWEMTGKDICRAVCRQLRARAFPEADPAISSIITEPAE